MHLMSFYATPYASKHREERNAKKSSLTRIIWFASGALCGILAAYLFGGTHWSLGGSDSVNSSEHIAKIDALTDLSLSSKDPDETSTTAEDKLLARLGEISSSETKTNNPENAETEASIPVISEAKETWPKTTDITVTSGDTLLSILTTEGIAYQQAYMLAKQIDKTYDLRKLRPGHEMTLVLDQGEPTKESEVTGEAPPNILKQLIIYTSKLEQVEIEATGSDTYRIQKTKKKLVTEKGRAKTSIQGSLYESASKQGMPAKAILKLMKNYSYDIDFQRDIKGGDKLDVLYEFQKTEDGDVADSGDVGIVYSLLETGGRTLKQYRFKDEHGFTQYYNEKGHNIVKKLLKTPVDGARMSSGYGMRKHPILGYSRMHTGVDFAVPRGTPIYAAGDGTITYAGYKGSYGKYVSIKHNNTYSTAYAHAHRIAKNIKNGKRVKQGQVIAYVGSTGRSTGPHLHYEILRNGRHVNPKNVKFTGGNALKGKRLSSFKQHIKSLNTQIATMPIGIQDTTRLAANTQE